MKEKIDWPKHPVPEQALIVEDIVGLCTMFLKNVHPIGEFQLDVAGGFIYSLFITWQRADPINKSHLLPVMIEMIDKYRIDEKADEIRKTNPMAKEMCSSFLEEKGIILKRIIKEKN